jgi:hypothetical protein
MNFAVLFELDRQPIPVILSIETEDGSNTQDFPPI